MQQDFGRGSSTFSRPKGRGFFGRFNNRGSRPTCQLCGIYGHVANCYYIFDSTFMQGQSNNFRPPPYPQHYQSQTMPHHQMQSFQNPMNFASMNQSHDPAASTHYLSPHTSSIPPHTILFFHLKLHILQLHSNLFLNLNMLTQTI